MFYGYFFSPFCYFIVIFCLEWLSNPRVQFVIANRTPIDWLRGNCSEGLLGRVVLNSEVVVVGKGGGRRVGEGGEGGGVVEQEGLVL